MGNQQMKPILAAVQALLKQRKLHIPERVLCNFLKEVDHVAPWFVITGSLTRTLWAKLGGDLLSEKEGGKLHPGTWPIYKMIRACIEDEKCQDTLKEGQKALTEHQDSLSEAEKGGGPERRKPPRKKEKPRKEINEKPRGLYPALDEFKKLKIDTSSEETSFEEEERQKQEVGVRSKNKTLELDSEDEQELEKEAAKYESGRYGPNPPYAPGATPSAPLLEMIEPRQHSKQKKGTKDQKMQEAPKTGSSTLIPDEVRKEIKAAFPVWEDANQVRQYSVLDVKQLKTLAESVQTYGVNASFTQALVERLTTSAMTPEDWYNTVKACLTMGQYLDWKSIYQDLCASQARQNAAQQHPQWSLDMLTGQGQWAANQINYPGEVYEQINKAAVKAWKSLPNKGQVTGNLTRIIQGTNETFSDFVARMMEAAGRVFGDPDTAMPLIEQLVYEQCTKEYRNAITPWKAKGINAWMKAYREIGGPLSNSGLAVAVLAAQRKSSRKCYNCGKPGHLQKECRNKTQIRKPPGICPRCNKGKHWSSECRSEKDKQGKPLSEPSKNGPQGPHPQGPRIYGVMNKQRRESPKEQQQGQQD
ncbi:igE-binding protein-like [Grammomys surdaster]|uniref:igE-binding protein-like n=1 Tax=Grammomys surdaster TaxID=491861 RepID=UPI00109F1CDA|nr:igE-binding protein-like [Grammomys surdaster]